MEGSPQRRRNVRGETIDRSSGSKNVLVIVVDMSRNDGDNLKLVYFGAPKDEKGQYDLNWVIHPHNLAVSRISNASSALVVYEGGDPASKVPF
jgi:hypothetical protein